MRRAALAIAVTTLAALAFATLGAGPAAAAFGLKEPQVSFVAADGSIQTQAGSHPFALQTSFKVNTVEEGGKIFPDESPRDIFTTTPQGLVGNPTATPRCSGADFALIDTQLSLPSCSDSSAVGVAEVQVAIAVGVKPTEFVVPIYNLIPAPGSALKLGFVVYNVPVTLEAGLGESPPYNVVARATNVSQAVGFFGAEVTLWGNPANHAHDSLRGSCINTLPLEGEPISRGECPVSIPEEPFLTLPTSCSGPLTTIFKADSWQHPVSASPYPYEGSAESNGMSGCGKLGFSPQMSSEPTNSSGESPTGLDFHLDSVDEGLTNPTGVAHSALKKAEVTLPAGMTVNPSQAEGLGVCSEADLARETATSAPGQGCPNSSKIGTVEVETPLLEGEVLKGALFVAKPYENRFGSLIAVYMTIKSRDLGIAIKLAGKVVPDPRTGQLVSTFDDLPQVPFSHFRLHFREGGRSPLVTPPTCGAYATTALFTPWSDPASTYATASGFQVSSGPGGGPCPAAGTQPFHPGFTAGSINNAAGQYSPYYMNLTRTDGEQDLTRFSSVLPPGVTGKLAGIAQCPQVAVEAAKARTGAHGGREELERPSCPASSRIGRTLTGAGVGPELTYVPGSLYLGGPFHGDPLSVVAIVPAVAGPFDVGTVVVQEALAVNPDTAEVEVDGAASDPIPHILAGIPLKVRDIRVYADRPDFTLNPTSCKPSATKATLWGGGANPFSVADDLPLSLQSRFQAASCASLALKPRLSLKLKGGTRRAAHPALTAQLTYPPGAGYANIAKAQVTLPHSAFLEQGHIRTVCTRVQFAAHNCPPGSIYGRARAVTPLLSEPLEGPVYLRSSSNPLPDLVVALHGLVDINLVGRIDSVRASIRTSFESVPDAPVSSFTLEMQGGKKGLIVNSRNLCTHPSKADAVYTGHNGRIFEARPVVKPSCKKKPKKPKPRRR